MIDLHNKLLTDYTLFNLNDPATTKYYIDRIDFLIDNFVYFQDISIVADYFTSTNSRFTAKFRTKLSRFVGIIYKVGCEDSEDRNSTTNNPPAIHLEVPQASNDPVVTRLYPSDEESEIGSSGGFDIDELGSVGEVVEMMGRVRVDGASDDSTVDSSTVDSNTNKPTTNTPATILKYYCKVIHSYLGMFKVNNKFVQALINKLEYDDVHNLLIALLSNGQVLPILVKNGHVPRIINKNLKSLHAVLDGVFYSSRNKIEDEEEFVDQVERYKEVLIERFLEIGLESGSIARTGCSTALIDEQTNNCSTKLSVEFSTIYKILLLLCKNRSSANLKYFNVVKINRYSLYYLRLLSYNQTFNNQEYSNHLICLFFVHTSITHLLTSIVRIITKIPVDILVGTGFFERMYSVCYDYIGYTKERVGGGSDGVGDGTDNNSCNIDKTGCNIDKTGCNTNNHTLFSFLVRLYMKHSTFIKTTFPKWDVLHELMDIPCKLEKSKYSEESLDILVEYEGFERFVIENMINGLPYPSIFKG